VKVGCAKLLNLKPVLLISTTGFFMPEINNSLVIFAILHYYCRYSNTKEIFMHKVTAKRQITLPQAVCQSINLRPGDYVEVFERDGVAHIVKMSDKNLAGKFQHLLENKTFPSDEEMKEVFKQRAAAKFSL
jgi:AbrB family looped-hinge helix DNA binding protein